MSRSKRHIVLAETILREAREELARADGKSSLLLAAAGVALGAIIAAIVAGDWTPFHLAPCVQWLWWVGSASGIGAIVAFAYSVYPRTAYRGERVPAIIAYFGDVVATPANRLEANLIRTAKGTDTRVFDQLKIISGIVDRKYRGIQLGLWLVALASFACTAAVGINSFL